MSTRRARIKAVTSLPPRRKNAGNAEAAKKQVQAGDIGEKAVRSPRTPRSLGKAIDITEKKSPLKNVAKTPNLRTSSPRPDPEHMGRQTPKLAEKLPNINNTAAIKQNVFISPQSPVPRGSPVVKSRLALDEVAQRLGKQISVKLSTVSQKVTEKPSVNETNNSHVKESRCLTPDVDYNVPSVPESLPEDTVMDGIVPLQSAGAAPNPIALLKNEIISENAEVLFDPIVPLPSPSPNKVRPKLRPVPRLTPLRRSSVQGSASESEDESRRALLNSGSVTPAPPARQRLDSQTSHSTVPSVPNREENRTRNDSVCSNMSQTPVQTGPVAGSPVREKNYSKSRRNDTVRQDSVRRLAAMRRRHEVVKRDTLTMYDLIFYNPTSNPFIPDQDEIKAKEADAKEQAEAEKKEEEDEDDPPTNAPPVPQVKIGPNGEIVLDEKSLVIKPSEDRKVTSVVREGAWGGGGRYKRAPRSAEWSDPETVRFYRALAALGTDFTLMEPLFPGRTRRELKLKFKKEEKTNGAQVDKALRTGAEWDATRLQREFDDERREAARREEERRVTAQREERTRRKRARAARDLALRTSRGTKALDYTSIPVAEHNRPNSGTADSLIKRMLEIKEGAKMKARLHKEAAKASRNSLPNTPEPNSEYATLTLINRPDQHSKPTQIISRVEQSRTPLIPPVVPQNIESGSLVVLTVNDPNSPSKKMLQTYIARGEGRLTPVDLPSSFLSSVVGYMKRSTSSASSSPQLMSPPSVSQDSNASNLIQPSPAKRERHSSFTISQL